MSIGTRDHRPSPVRSVLVSQASRSMASEPQVKFADLEQEIAWLKNRKAEICDEITRERDRYASDLEKLSRSGLPFSTIKVRKEALLRTFETTRARLAVDVQQVEKNLADAKLRKKQRDARWASEHKLNGSGADPRTGLRVDGTIDAGTVMLMVLDELRSMNAKLDRMLDANK